MKRISLMAGAAALAAALISCNQAVSVLPAGVSAAADALGIVDSSGAVASSVSVDLLAGQTILAGSVTVGVEEPNLTVTYATADGWKLQEVQLSVGVGFSSIPTNRAGNPVVGQFAYKATALGGAESYAFAIPLADLGAATGTTLTVAAHAVVYKTTGDGSVRTETAWGAGSRINAKGNWATFFTVTIGETPEEQKETSTETAFAYGGQYAIDFGQFDVSARWGWTNGPLSAGQYSFPIYAGAGQSDISKGTDVGTLTVSYEGTRAIVTYAVKSGFVLTETHLYVGSEQLPSFKGEYTVAPGQYPNKHGSLADVSADSFTVQNLSGPVYVVAHAVIKGYF